MIEISLPYPVESVLQSQQVNMASATSQRLLSALLESDFSQRRVKLSAEVEAWGIVVHAHAGWELAPSDLPSPSPLTVEQQVRRALLNSEGQLIGCTHHIYLERGLPRSEWAGSAGGVRLYSWLSATRLERDEETP